MMKKIKQPLYDYVVLDIETTGLKKERDEIIQVSAVKFKQDQELDYLDTLIKPVHKQISPFIENLTGISNSDVDNAPEITEIIPKLYDFIGDQPLIGHNVMFDLSFLKDNGLNLPQLEFVDTLDIAQAAQSQLKLPNTKLKTLKNYFGIDNRSHNSLNDVKTTAVVYQKLRDAGYLQKPSRPKFRQWKSKDYFYDQFDKSLSKNEINKKRALFGNQLIDKLVVPENKSKLKDQIFVFTGDLKQLPREQAQKIVEGEGGMVKKSVVLKTDYVVVGIENPAVVVDGKSTKQRRAEELNATKGKNIQIINEEQFMNMIQ